MTQTGKLEHAPFEFATASRILFGTGALKEAAPLAKGFGARTLLVTGRERNRAAGLVSTLENQRIQVLAYGVAGEPRVEDVEKGVALGRQERVEMVVAFGGGSAIDAGKAIAAMLTNPGSVLDYLEVIGRGKMLTLAPAPFIAIPTTAGTGTEVTRNAVLASPEHKVKVSLRSPLMLPRIAIVDPELTFELPPAMTASTGLDALTQLIEPYVSSRANPLTDPLCLDGIRRIGRSLRTAFRDGRNRAAREDMALASLFGGLALANAGLGAVHGFAGPLGGMFPAPHGAVCAALLPQVMECNLNALRRRQPQSESLRRYQEIARVLTGEPDAVAEQGIDWVRRLTADLQIPSLRTYGTTTGHIVEVAEKAAKASSMKANPIVLTREELSAVLTASL